MTACHETQPPPLRAAGDLFPHMADESETIVTELVTVSSKKAGPTSVAKGGFGPAPEDSMAVGQCQALGTVNPEGAGAETGTQYGQKRGHNTK